MPSPVLVRRIRPSVPLTRCLFDQIRTALLGVKRVRDVVPNPLSFKDVAALIKLILFGDKHCRFLSEAIEVEYPALVALEFIKDPSRGSYD